MSRLAGLGSIGTMRLSSNFVQLAALTQFIDKVVEEQCENELEKAASELADKMKAMLLRNECGLARNTDFTQGLKGSSVPLIDSGQLANAITYKLYDGGQMDVPGAKTNNFKAAFVGIMRNGPLKSGGSLIGSQTPVALYTVAKNQVKGYSVKMPNNNAVKKVVARDFRKVPYDEFKEEFLERMKDGVASGFARMV
jgi:hypothetical protein